LADIPATGTFRPGKTATLLVTSSFKFDATVKGQDISFAPKEHYTFPGELFCPTFVVDTEVDQLDGEI